MRIHTTIIRYDSLLPERNYASLHANTFLEILDAENNFRQSGNMQKTMSKLFRIAGMKKTVRNNKLSIRLLLDLANISTRLKMYPLAMKCYGQAIRIKQEKDFSTYEASQDIKDTINYLRLMIADTLDIIRHSSNPVTESPLVLFSDIQSSFQDGKIASSYAIIVHVKQPVPGKRKAFVILIMWGILL